MLPLLPAYVSYFAGGMERQRHTVARAAMFVAGFALVFCLLEYTLWVISCYYAGDEMTNPYYLVDLLITAGFPIFLIGTKKAVQA